MGMLTDCVMVLGGNGYLGWTLALARAARNEGHVVIVDNLNKLIWERQAGVSPLMPSRSPMDRIENYRKIYGRANMSFEHIDVTNFDAILETISRHRPATIINAAQQPSAPFSMMSANNGRLTFNNNTATAINVLWAISLVDPDINYIGMGSSGTYLSIDAEFVPHRKVDLALNYQGRGFQIADTWIPMHASDFYHQSKITSFLATDLCASLWGLRVRTIQQSTIFGHAIPENEDEANHELLPRINYDSIFGTVLNRFVCQSAAGLPITVYGEGAQTTGVISLRDTIDAVLRLIALPSERGHLVEHNFTHRKSIMEMAREVASLVGADIEQVENPRLEPCPMFDKQFEEPSRLWSADGAVSFRRDLEDLHALAQRYRTNIDARIMMPSVKWGSVRPIVVTI